MVASTGKVHTGAGGGPGVGDCDGVCEGVAVPEGQVTAASDSKYSCWAADGDTPMLYTRRSSSVLLTLTPKNSPAACVNSPFHPIRIGVLTVA